MSAQTEVLRIESLLLAHKEVSKHGIGKYAVKLKDGEDIAPPKVMR